MTFFLNCTVTTDASLDSLTPVPGVNQATSQLSTVLHWISFTILALFTFEVSYYKKRFSTFFKICSLKHITYNILCKTYCTYAFF